MIDVGSTPVIATGSGDGFGGGMGIWAILLLALLGGGGFGNRGNEAARETQIVNDNMNSRFNSLENMNEMSFMAQANNINHVEAMESSRDNYRNICETQRMIQTAQYDNAIISKNAEISNLKSNCETQQAIASSTASILARFDQAENQNLRDKIGELQLAYSQCNQNSQLINALRPYPSPSYVTYNPQQSFFPPQPAVAASAAYGTGCGCGGY